MFYYFNVCLFSCFLIIVSAEDLLFPPGFKFGAASSAYQIEGGWNASDKSPNIWDTHVRRVPSPIIDGSTGDVACDSYRLWRRDVEMLKELGVHFYRFSISWSRLLPTGFPDVISEDGKNYYNNLIDALVESGIEPMVTLFHNDLPQRLQDLGGWTNPLIVQWFTSYAQTTFRLFGDRVKYWLTVNEPVIYCGASYALGLCAPAIDDPSIGYYLCSKYMLLAHAEAYRSYEREFKDQYHGKISFTNQLFWIEPNNPGDEALTELSMQYYNGVFSHPIYSPEGGWPKIIEDLIAQKSREEGFTESRLPALTKEEREIMRGSYDFYAFNYYTSRTVRLGEVNEKVPPFPLDGIPELNAVFESRKEWKQAPLYWLKIYPEGLRKLLKWVKDLYGNPEIIITENGYASIDSELEDDDRVEYYSGHLKHTLLAIKEDGVNITGYTAWTLMDNFEWPMGYTNKFGLYFVNFTSPERTRTMKKSGKYFRDIISLNKNNKAHVKTEL